MRKLKVLALVLFLMWLTGCATGPCLRSESRPVYRTVCDRYSDTGHCASSHTESSMSEVCVERGDPFEYDKKQNKKKQDTGRFSQAYGFDMAKESLARAAVKENGKWGFINKAGQLIIKPQFDEIKQMKYEWTIEGDQYMPAFGSSWDVVAVRVGDKWGFVDRYGLIIIPYQFDEVGSMGQYYVDNYAVSVRIGEKWGYVNEDGVVVSRPQFDEAKEMVWENSAAPVRIGGKWGFINAKGVVIYKPQFDEVGGLGYGYLFYVKIGGKVGFYNSELDIMIKPQFEKIVKFKGYDLAPVKYGGKWGYIDKTGKFVIEPKYDIVSSFNKDGVATAAIGEKKYFISKTGSEFGR